MTIRSKLTLSVTLLFAAALGTLGLVFVRLERVQLEKQAEEDARIIASTVDRAARDALVQRDDLLLLSYVKFLQKQFPALSYVEVSWMDAGRARTHRIGTSAGAAPSTVMEHTLRVKDPTSPDRQVQLDIGIDQGYFHDEVDKQIGRIGRDLARLFGIALIAAALFSDWFARKLTRPLAALSEVAGEIGRGKLGVRLEWKSNDEVGALVEGFNRMSQRLEELDMMKKDFVSAVTHELRSPLGAIESFLALMQGKMVGGRPTDPVQFQTYFDRIRANVTRLTGFINDLLDVAKIERGKMECSLRPMRIQEVASEVVQFFEAKAKEQGVTLLTRLDANLSPVSGDPERLRQVLVNLVSNSIKFTPQGGSVWISGEQYREAGARFLEVSVVDNGRGMEPDDLKKLFEKFAQGKNAEARISGPRGTGLGLVIVKSIVEAHGGKVGVKSQPGKGTQFQFSVKMT
ncbi:MAG: HAMP domain-containing histidine kinase [Elusimicrobia bacterium]|nr:HAMP domain-containing histidine kinase [Elusimicrobiota bacterium]